MCYPPVSEASREVANLNERKNPHAPVYGVKECASSKNCEMGLFRRDLDSVFRLKSNFKHKNSYPD